MQSEAKRLIILLINPLSTNCGISRSSYFTCVRSAG